MIKLDLKAARKARLKAAKSDPQEHERRTKDDFLADVNEAGELLDFHALRHTCGAWLAQCDSCPSRI